VRVIDPTRTVARMDHALTEAEAALTETKARRSMGDLMAAILAEAVVTVAMAALIILSAIVVFVGAALLGGALVSPLYYGWPSPRAAIPGCLLGGAAMLRGFRRLLRGFRRLDRDPPTWQSSAYNWAWLYAGCGLSTGSVWAAFVYVCVCDTVTSTGGPLFEYQ